MFRSLASSAFSFLAILIFAFVVIFLYSGSSGVAFSRVAMDGDRSTAQVLEDFRKSQMEEVANADPLEAAETMEREPVQRSGDGPPVVLWVSIPGFRGDYIDKSDTPFFDDLID
ncbi:MAG: hypothetical protein AAF236_13110, partial [Verrucomicrobiota bacterium]